jgi:hypothetical protein
MMLLRVQSEAELVKLLEFLHISKVQFEIQDSERFEKLLYQGIDSEKIQPSWVRHEKFENHLQNIEGDLERAMIEESLAKDDTSEIQEHIVNIREFRKLVSRDYNTELMNTYFTPTEHFKGFCGPESLTPKGKITPNEILHFLEYQFKIREIPVKNGLIHTNEWVRTLLEDGREFIQHDDLHRIVFRLLKK